MRDFPSAAPILAVTSEKLNASGPVIALSARASELKNHHDLNRVVFIVTNMVEALSHGAVLRRPVTLSLAEAKQEVVKAVLDYLRA